MSVSSEGRGAVNESAVLLKALGDALLPLQAPDGGRVEGGEERQVRVEVVVLPQPLHDLDELDHQPLPLTRVLLLKNFGPETKTESLIPLVKKVKP